MKYLSKPSSTFLLVAFLLLLNNSSIFSQWNVIEEGNTRNKVCIADINTGWIVGDRGSIRKTTNGGENWIIQTSGVTNTLSAVCFANLTTGWAIGNSGLIINTTDGGTNWSIQQSGTTNGLNNIFFADNNTGWIVGNSGIILKTTDGGTNWITMTSGTTNHLRGIYFFDVNTGLVIGNSGTILKTTNGGTNWISQTSGTTAILRDIYFSDINTGWVVGNSGNIRKTTDGGTSWNAQTSGISSILYGVSFADNNTGWAVGANVNILYTIDGGANWTTQSSGTTNTLYGVKCVNASTCWIVGNKGTILKTTDAGTNWFSQSNSTGNHLLDIHFINNNYAWTVGNSGTIINTTNGGASWNIQTSGTTNALYGVYFTDANTGFIVGGSGTILKTIDGGASWNIQTSGTTDYLYGVYFTDANTGFIVGGSGTILKTIDGGANWNVQTSGTTNSLIKVHFTDAYTGWAAGENGTILKTTDGGANWVNQTSGTTNNLYDIHFSDNSNGWAVGVSGTILKTTDGGVNWVIQASETTNHLYGNYSVDANIGWAVGFSGTILNTTNGGANWNIQTSGTTMTLYGVHFTNENTGWAIGEYGYILKYSIISPLAAPILSSPQNNSNNQSINPTLIWQLVENVSSYSLQVSLTNDFSEFIINESGIENTEFQLNGLELNTTYFWRVKASNEEGENSAWSGIWSFTTLSVPWQVTQTNNSSTIIVPTSINPMLGDRPFAVGDAIGLFYQNDNNDWTCGGFSVWNGANLGIIVWGDNPDIPIKDGFAIGETYTFKVWDAMLEQEWNATATYQIGDDFYTIGGFSTLASLNVYIPTEQNISLASGWHMISSYIVPENADIENIFENIVTDVKIVKNGAGEMYDPAFNINTIGNWNYEDGYLVNMLNEDLLTITGTKLLPEETPINLNNGWNLSAYLRDNEMSPTAALASISPSLVLAKNNAGGIFSPSFGINTLGNMQAGQGYYFYMNAATELTYPANSAQKAVAGDEMTPLAKYNIPSMKNTGKNATLLISIENKEGNEIGVYNMNNELIGSGAVQNGIAAITIWGDDEATQNVDGAKDNEYLNVKLYNTTNNTSKEISLSQIKEITGNTEQNELYYKTNSIFVAKASANDEVGFAMSIKNIPNPVESNVVFEFTLTDEANAEIQIYTSTGELVAKIGNGNYSAGIHRINFDASNLANGMYNIVLSSGERRVTSFMIVGK